MIQKILRTDNGILSLIAFLFIAAHVLTNGQYGFHRDELATIDDARNMEWGFVAYPPFTPLMGRLGLSLFGISQSGIRLFPVLALAGAVMISGLIARELGGSRQAQVLAALAVAIAPIVTIQASVLQYVSFDYLWGALLTYFLVRLLNSEDPRWWLVIGATIGVGMMTKYTMGFFALGLAIAVLLTPARHYLRSPYLWTGVLISLLIFAPNALWQWKHNFISLKFLQHIHARDIRWGRTRGFIPEQLFVCMSVLLSPLAFMGLYFYFTARGRKYRLLGALFVSTFVLFLFAHARSYYMGPMYPLLLAAGSNFWITKIDTGGGANSTTRESHDNPRPASNKKLLLALTWSLVALGAISSFSFFTPIASINSKLWHLTAKLHDNYTEEIGWTDLVANVARVYESLPPTERQSTGILVGNYGEAGAINLFGPQYHLPSAISGTNSAWYRSYPRSNPHTIIAVGLDEDELKERFGHCEVAAHNTNPYGVINEESRDHPDIYLCRDMLQSWPEFWKHFQRFG